MCHDLYKRMLKYDSGISVGFLLFYSLELFVIPMQKFVLIVVCGLIALAKGEPPVVAESYGPPAAEYGAPVVEHAPVVSSGYGAPAAAAVVFEDHGHGSHGSSGGYDHGSSDAGFGGGYAQAGHGSSDAGFGGGYAQAGPAYVAAAPAPAIVEYGANTNSQGPTQIRSYHYHTHKRIPTHEVKHFQTHSTQAKKIIHQHNQHEKVIHQHNHHQHVLNEHHLHKVHLHNLHLQKHNIHQHNIHKVHVHQPIYHQDQSHVKKVTEEHKTATSFGETSEHKHQFHESKTHAAPIYKAAPGWGR